MTTQPDFPGDSLVPEVATTKSLYRRLAASVSVITAHGDRGPEGMTASSVMAVSVVPPLLLVSLRHTSSTLAAIRASQQFAVNLLTDAQHELAVRFATPRPGWVTFGGIELHSSQPPVLADVLAVAVCALSRVCVAGDHTLVVGEVHSAQVNAGLPLVWHDSDYHQVRPQSPVAPLAFS